MASGVPFLLLARMAPGMTEQHAATNLGCQARSTEMLTPFASARDGLRQSAASYGL